MPYPTNIDLPRSVHAHLPDHAQDVYREAFNHAYAAHVGEADQEERTHRIAWAAVKRSYVKAGESWIRLHPEFPSGLISEFLRFLEAINVAPQSRTRIRAEPVDAP